MLMDICNEAVLRINEFLPQLKKEDSNANLRENNIGYLETFISLIHLDHMRDKRNYIKIIEKWATDLNIDGIIIFHGKLKLFLLRTK